MTQGKPFIQGFVFGVMAASIFVLIILYNSNRKLDRLIKTFETSNNPKNS